MQVQMKASAFYRQHKEEFTAIIEMIGVLPIMIQKSIYEGYELVLKFNPGYRAITAVGIGSSSIYLYSKQEFDGATYDGMGTWDLTI